MSSDFYLGLLTAASFYLLLPVGWYGILLVAEWVEGWDRLPPWVEEELADWDGEDRSTVKR